MNYVNYVTDPATGCWLWLGHKTPAGYASVSVKRRPVRAHRLFYEQMVGPIPPGLVLDHLCRVRHCVNPAHLEPVTQRENVLRGKTIIAAQVARDHCIHGHLFDGVRPSGGRYCKTCNLEKSRRFRAARSQ